MNSLSEEGIREQATKDGITHLSTGVAILRNKKILVVRRAEDDFLGGYYELPGGGVDEDESIEQSAFREVVEETGLRPIRIIATFKGFDYSTDKKPKVRQINFIVEVASGAVVLSEEHDDFIWLGHEDLAKLKTTDSMLDCLNEAFVKADSI